MKKIVLLLAILLLTGCNVYYDVEITANGKVNETFTYEDQEYSIDGILEDEFVNYYEKNGYTVIELFNGFKMLKNYSSIDNFVNTSLGTLDIGKFSYDDDNKLLSIFVNEKNCMRLFVKLYEEDGAPTTDNASIRISSELGIISSNADSVNGKFHIWSFNKNNCNRTINIKFEKSLKMDVSDTGNDIIDDTNSTQENNNVDLGFDKFYFIVLLVVIVAIVLLFVYKKKNKNNEV